MKKIVMTFLIGVITILALTTVVPAEEVEKVDWSNSFLLQGSGMENPLVRVGFNPQPEPSAHPSAELNLRDPLTPVLTVPTGDDPGFRIIFGIAATEPLTINASGTPDENGLFTFGVTGPTGASFFDVFFDITTSSGGVADSLSWVGFNPQPEPPALLSPGTVGFDFNFTSLSEATLKLQVFDSQENPLSFTVIPEPSTMLLLGSGLLGLVGYARKRFTA